MSSELTDSVRQIVEQGDDADDILRSVVEALASSANATWAAIAFTENGVLGVGPSSGAPDEARRTRVSITFDGAVVGELWVDGDASPGELRSIANVLAPYVLIGWDTSGEAWEP